ncbi:MAG: DJ-1/PfpI family protein [Duodenibacillus sp.]|nr:DJ-1/PfpI family protein [Duodenibacillus sp.]
MRNTLKAAALSLAALASCAVLAQPSVMVLMSPGFEEGETVEILDVVRRGGARVDAVSIAGEYVPGAHNIVIKADRVMSMEMKDLKDYEGYDMIVLPGGWTGTDHLVADKRVIELVKRYDKAGKFVASMCAAPNALAAAGVLKGKRMTAYPGKKTEPFYKDAIYTGEVVTVDGKLITSKAPGTALPFAFALVDALGGDSLTIKKRFYYDEMKAWPDGAADSKPAAK